MSGAPQVFKAYDVRGTVPDQLDAGLCRAIGAAFAAFTGAPTILVARDMRLSGIELSAAFTEGARDVGTSVIDLGLASTDLLYFASGRLDAPGAMFTASHNPARYNGIKMCLSGARPVGQDTGLADIAGMVLDGGQGSPGRRDGGQARDAPAEGRSPSPARLPGGPRGELSHLDLIEEYAVHVCSFVDLAALRPLRVVADTANGMGGLVVPRVFARLPFHLDLLYGELDGSFPNHPADPIQPENLADLRQRVVDTGADAGLAFDGDADRVFLVDDLGQPLSGSLTTALVAQAILAKRPGATILYNLICSRVVPEVVEEAGGVAVRTRVGHSFIKALMAETGAAFGGEHSGHYYFLDNYRADSGIIAALLMLEVMSVSGQPLSKLRLPLERYANSGEINTEVDDPERVIEEVARAYAARAEIDRLDGLTAQLDGWWFNLRPSNTEPLLRLNLEAADQAACHAHVAEVVGLIKDSSGPGPGVQA